MSNLILAAPPDAEMDEDRRDDTLPGRRATDGQLVRAADSAISIGWRWIQILAAIVGFGFMAGVFWVQSERTSQALTDLRGDISEFRNDLSKLREERQNAALAVADNRKDIEAMKVQNAELREQVRDLRNTVDTMRSMREAYVYSQAGRSKLGASPP